MPKPPDAFEPWAPEEDDMAGLDSINKRVKRLTVRDRIKRAYTGPKTDAPIFTTEPPSTPTKFYDVTPAVVPPPALWLDHAGQLAEDAFYLSIDGVILRYL